MQSNVFNESMGTVPAIFYSYRCFLPVFSQSLQNMIWAIWFTVAIIFCKCWVAWGPENTISVVLLLTFITYFVVQVTSEAYSDTQPKFKMELFAKIVQGFQPFKIFAKNSILDIWLDSKCASGTASNFFPAVKMLSKYGQ